MMMMIIYDQAAYDTATTIAKNNLLFVSNI